MALPVALKAADMEKGADAVGELVSEPMSLVVDDEVPVASAEALAPLLADVEPVGLVVPVALPEELADAVKE